MMFFPRKTVILAMIIKEDDHGITLANPFLISRKTLIEGVMSGEFKVQSSEFRVFFCTQITRIRQIFADFFLDGSAQIR